MAESYIEHVTDAHTKQLASANRRIDWRARVTNVLAEQPEVEQLRFLYELLATKLREQEARDEAAAAAFKKRAIVLLPGMDHVADRHAGAETGSVSDVDLVLNPTATIKQMIVRVLVNDRTALSAGTIVERIHAVDESVEYASIISEIARLKNAGIIENKSETGRGRYVLAAKMDPRPADEDEDEPADEDEDDDEEAKDSPP